MTAAAMTRDDVRRLFDEARRIVKVSDVAGVKLGRVGSRLRGQCPVCLKGKGKTKDGPFWVDDFKGAWGCFAGQGACAEGGDVIRLEQLIRGGTPREIAARFAGPGFTPTARATIVQRAERPAATAQPEVSRAAARILREAVRADAGGLVDRYLAGRGIGPEVRAVMLGALRFAPGAFYDVLPEGVSVPAGGTVIDIGGGRRGVTFAAMVAEVRTGAQRTGGVHLTFLARDPATGRVAKARVRRAKKMLGPQSHAGLPGGAILSPMTGVWGERPLIVGEGIETVGSAAELRFRRFGIVPRMAAALSLDRLQGGWAADARGRYDVETPGADLTRPAFTLPDAGEVLLAVDRDMGPITVQARGPGGRPIKRELDSDARARVCGAVAGEHWLVAGAGPVRVIAPPAGMDWNDQLQALAQTGSAA
jgi:hypothetical protein